MMAIFSAVQLPIYPDEVAYKIFLERFFLNGGFKQSITPYCTAGFMIKPSVALIPAAALWSLTESLGSHWMSYRILPILSLIMIVAMLIVHSLRYNARVPWSAILLVTAGPTVYGLIIFRPEIFILAGGLMIFFICKHLQKEEQGWAIRIMFSILLIALYSAIAYIHPKALYLTPLVVIGSCLSARCINKPFLRFLYMCSMTLLTFWIAISAVNLHKAQFLTCPEVPRIETAMSNQAINIMSMMSDAPKFFDGVKKATSLTILDKTLGQLSFKKNYDIHYLPPIESIGMIEQWVNHLNLIVIVSALAVVLYGAVFLSRYIPVQEYWLIISLAFGYLTPFFLNLSKFWYEVSFFVGALMIIFWLCATRLFSISMQRGIVGFSTKILWPGCVLLSSGFTIALINYHFTENFKIGYSGPGISLNTNREKIKYDIEHILFKHNIFQDTPLIVDDMTYDALKKHSIIVPATYLVLIDSQLEILNKTLNDNNINYGVVKCSFFDSIASKLVWQLIESNINITSLPNERICLFSVGAAHVQSPKKQ